MRPVKLLTMDVRDLAGTAAEAFASSRARRLLSPGATGFCAVLLLAAGLCLWAFIPDSHFSGPVPLRSGPAPSGFSLATTVRGAEGTAWRAFDGSLIGECFHSARGSTTGTITMTFPGPLAAGRLRLAPQNDLLARTPRDFKLEALEENGGWRTVAAFSGISPSSYTPYGFTDLPVNVPKAYKTYRLSITANNGGEYLTFSELSLEEPVDARPGKLLLLIFCCAGLAALCGAGKAHAWLDARFPEGKTAQRNTHFAALALPPFTLLFLLPAQVFLGNAAEFQSPAAPLLLILLTGALTAYGALLLVHSLVPARAGRLLAALALTAGTAIWLQAAVWPWTGGELNGGALGWELVGGMPQLRTSPAAAYLQAGLWVFGSGLAFLAPALLARFSLILPLALLGAQLAGLARKAPELPAMLADKSACTAPGELLRFSSDATNAAVIVLDMFQSDLFEEIRGGADKRLTAGLEGFTYFRNTVAGFPVTQGAVPEILTGEAFDNARRLPEYLRSSFRTNSLPKSAAAGGWTVALKSWTAAAYYIDREIVPDSGPCLAPARLAEDAAQLLDMALFEAVPDLAKPFVYSGGRWFLSRLAADIPYMGKHGELWTPGSTKAGDIRFVAEFQRAGRAVPGPGAFKFFHLMGNHVPLDMDEDLRTVKMSFDRESSLRQGKGALRLLGKILDKMKSLGVYDNSVIFVLADHGSGLPVVSPRRGAAASGWLARGLPLLLVKDAGGRGPLKISDAPAALEDVPFTLARRLGWSWTHKAEDLFSIKPGLKRRRRFTLANSVRDGKFGTFGKYEVYGHAWDAASWRETGERLDRIK